MKKTYINPIQHGHRDEDAQDWEPNTTIHQHDGGDKWHVHKNEPSWGATGRLYRNPEQVKKLLESDAWE